MDVFDNMLINLRVLQSLQCHNRLDTSNTLFKIHTPAQWLPAWLRRWWGSQTRLTDISRIQTLYAEATQYIKAQNPHHERLQKYMADSLRGLRNLQTTYMNDPTTVALIDVILDSVECLIG
tara:strand:- start:1187 stop:1549 length:363 start_codon:yes stop_codon:yes gene_type:complete